jgi:hypothetical protein
MAAAMGAESWITVVPSGPIRCTASVDPMSPEIASISTS